MHRPHDTPLPFLSRGKSGSVHFWTEKSGICTCTISNYTLSIFAATRCMIRRMPAVLIQSLWAGQSLFTKYLHRANKSTSLKCLPPAFFKIHVGSSSPRFHDIYEIRCSQILRAFVVTLLHPVFGAHTYVRYTTVLKSPSSDRTHPSHAILATLFTRHPRDHVYLRPPTSHARFQGELRADIEDTPMRGMPEDILSSHW